MGSCMSRKVGEDSYAYTAYTMETGITTGPQGEKGSKRSTPYTRGQATSFGFKRHPPAVMKTPATDSANKPKPTSAIKPPQRSTSQASLNSDSPLSSGRSTPKSRSRENINRVPSRVNRFGFRTVISSSEKETVADANCNMISSQDVQNLLNKSTDSKLSVKQRPKSSGKSPTVSSASLTLSSPGSGNAKSKVPGPVQSIKTSRYTLQSRQLPQPQVPIIAKPLISPSTNRLVNADGSQVSKIAKTAANRKMAQEEQRDGSLDSLNEAEDSGLGTLESERVGEGETDTLLDIEQIDSSELWLRDSGRALSPSKRRPRTLEMVVHNNSGVFELREKQEQGLMRGIKRDEAKCGVPRPINSGVVRQKAMIYQKKSSPVTEVPNKPVGIAKKIPRDATKSDEINKITLDTGRLLLGAPVTHLTSVKRDNQDEGLGEEEKAWRDRSCTEKGKSPIEDDDDEDESITVMPEQQGSGDGTPSDDQEDWGPGEAMADDFSEDSRAFSVGASTSETVTFRDGAGEDVAFEFPSEAASSGKKHPGPHAVHLTIEIPPSNPSSALTVVSPLEKSVDSLFSSTDAMSSSSSEGTGQSPPRPATLEVISPPTGGSENSWEQSGILSPSPTSNSLSEADQRDFLIDDEIADQPGLTFGQQDVSSKPNAESFLQTDNTLVELSKSAKCSGAEDSPARPSSKSRTTSLDTLSPCESITSDDMMLDYEQSDGSTFNESLDRLECVSLGEASPLRKAFDLDDCRSSASDDLLREWSTLLDMHTKDGLVGRPSRLLRSRAASTPDVPRPFEARPRTFTGSLRPPRQTSATESEDGGIRLDRGTYQYMFQDIVNLKTMLLKLKRVLHEDGENSIRAETLNPFDSTLKNGLYYNLANNDPPASATEPEVDANSQGPQEEIVDLKRQVVFLQQQLEEKDRTIQLLQQQMLKYTNNATEAPHKESCNTATQTERLRPLSTGSAIPQSCSTDTNMGSLVSSTDASNRKKNPEVGKGGLRMAKAGRLPSAGTEESSSSSKASGESSIPRKYSALPRKVTGTAVTRRT